MAMTFSFFEVGGAVRDTVLAEARGESVHVKDVDFTVVADGADGREAGEVFEAMVAFLTAEGFTPHVVKPEFLTVRAGVPDGHVLRERTKDADFVLARRDGPSADGRRPAFVEAGTLLDDLARRDFTVNAMARSVDGVLVDPFGGAEDLLAGVLRFVGDGMERVREDGLRVLRGFRFMVTKGLVPDEDTFAALTSVEAAEMLSAVSTERVREELERMFAHDTLATLDLLGSVPEHTRRAMFPPGLRLSATLRR
jgi:tRNA nucleotidyltransferase/poly(A) polymerase